MLEDNVILKLRDENKSDLKKVIGIGLSHSRVSAKNNLILAILDIYEPLLQSNSSVAASIREALKETCSIRLSCLCQSCIKGKRNFNSMFFTFHQGKIRSIGTYFEIICCSNLLW